MSALRRLHVVDSTDPDGWPLSYRPPTPEEFHDIATAAGYVRRDAVDDDRGSYVIENWDGQSWEPYATLTEQTYDQARRIMSQLNRKAGFPLRMRDLYLCPLRNFDGHRRTTCPDCRRS